MIISVVRLGGSGPLLVLGPSLGTSTATLWTRCAERLTDRFQVLAWDLPGHGAGPPAAGAFSIAELATAVLQATDTEIPFHYAGDSVGGAVGLQLLLDHPDRVSTATVLCTGARIGTAEGWRQRAELVRERGTQAVVDIATRTWFGPGFADREPETAAALLDALRGTDPGSYAWTCEALARFDVRDRLGEIAAPVLAVAGEYDQPAPIAGLREIAVGVRSGRLDVLPGVAHQAPAEAPAEVARLIAEHAARPPEPSEPQKPPKAPKPPGLAVRRAVLGDEHVDRAIAGTTEFTRDFQDFITRYAWGQVWTRPGLDRRSRSMITLTALIAGGHDEELALHVRAARRNGLTVDEIKEVLLHAAIYCGVPAANAAFRIAQRVLAESDDT
jgi:3-oxoadipate enol-lactonase/4-carboxymuconolactone decarboxylase